MSIRRHTVHVRVNDAATGQPTPVRIRLSGEGGEYFPPFGRLADFPTGPNEEVGANLLLGANRYAYIDGTCEVALPAGPVKVEVSKGPEFEPISQTVPLAEGKLALRFALSRRADLRQSGWYSGDGRAHFLSPHAALLEAAAEDLAVVNLLIKEASLAGADGRPRLVLPQVAAFSGQSPALENPGHLVVVNTLNDGGTFGRLALLNCHRVVYPLSLQGLGTPAWTLSDWCRQCHRKGGLVIWSGAPARGLSDAAGEALADVVLGEIDALEVDRLDWCSGPHDVWYALLNAGIRVPLVGASGKETNGTALGAVRTYAQLLPGEPLTYKGWVEALRAGRTFVTNGPLLTLTVERRDPGAVLDLPTGGTVKVRAEIHAPGAAGALEIVANGSALAAAHGRSSAEAEIGLPSGGWLAARYHAGPLPGTREGAFAHTSPVYLRPAGQPLPAEPASVQALKMHLNSVERRAREGAGTAQERQHLVQILRSAADALEQRLSRRPA